ncbi:MAG: 23S rRNA pseudouridine(955/2504/2580) synthase RluC [Pseudomonadota bacterium]|nr:23S rRNA pseudouridine(955/2504/2580) synthase RluC [Pseudomonadota bacterium]
MTDYSENDKIEARFIEIDIERVGQRIDNFLMAQLRSVPKSMIYKILRTGQVRVNKGRIKPVYRLQVGDVVRIPPLRVSPVAEEVSPSQGVLRQIEQSIIFEDDALIVLNKPSGIAVHGGSGLSYGVIEAMRKLRPELPGLELVHRLDRDTSGCLLLAKKRSVLRQLHELMRNGQVGKHYLALCQGKWKGGARDVDAPLLKNTLSSGERMVRVTPTGKEALSRFTPQLRFKAATLMEVELMTGRTHQIRVHATHSGHPLAGDDKYGDKEFNQQMKGLGLRRLFLHAQRIYFPWGDGRLEFQAPLGDDLEAVLKHLA